MVTIRELPIGEHNQSKIRAAPIFVRLSRRSFSSKKWRIKPPSANFTVADLNAHGELQLKAEYDYASLEQIPAAAEIMVVLATALYRSPEEFEAKLWRPNLLFRWRSSAATAGIATLRCQQELASLSLLATGIDPDADQITLGAFQSHLLHQLHDTGIEPAFALLNLPERPLVATVNFLSPPDEMDRFAVALADRCFAAVYFRYHHLA